MLEHCMEKCFLWIPGREKTWLRIGKERSYKVTISLVRLWCCGEGKREETTGEILGQKIDTGSTEQENGGPWGWCLQRNKEKKMEGAWEIHTQSTAQFPLQNWDSRILQFCYQQTALAHHISSSTRAFAPKVASCCVPHCWLRTVVGCHMGAQAVFHDTGTLYRESMCCHMIGWIPLML